MRSTLRALANSAVALDVRSTDVCACSTSLSIPSRFHVVAEERTMHATAVAWKGSSWKGYCFA